ncbi:uncharacterized protein C8Q71DRAFT_728193 [Rhodofomes roseus]|uniref:Uncharacterized protein n=1 Tax=Rhodofomes roseus TaxID=34475 RepID=A0ABQ8JYJ4_9APHY|nr:uncharacterized protein C8Q71DRAFT_728193 [Rhodofomes roseus]KAH9829329.1 hypothetical protein C8Q71DRAFT_728193 [Rhodofomes roseus]
MSLQIVPWEPEQLPTLQRSESVDADINTGNVPPSRPVLPSNLKKKCATFTKKMWRENGVRVCFLVAANTTDIGPVVSLVDHNAIIGAPSNFSDVTRDPKWNSTNLWSDWERFATDLLGEKPRSVLDARVAQQRADFGRLFATDEATGLPIIPPPEELEKLETRTSQEWQTMVYQFLVEHHTCTANKRQAAASNGRMGYVPWKHAKALGTSLWLKGGLWPDFVTFDEPHSIKKAHCIQLIRHWGQLQNEGRAFRMSGWLASDAKHGMQPPMYDEWATRDAQRREAERQAERQVAEEQAAADQAAEEQAAAEQAAEEQAAEEQAAERQAAEEQAAEQAAEEQAAERQAAEEQAAEEQAAVRTWIADHRQAAEKQAVEGLPAEEQAAARTWIGQRRQAADRQADEGEVAERQAAVARTWIVQQRQAAERQAAEGQAEAVPLRVGRCRLAALLSTPTSWGAAARVFLGTVPLYAARAASASCSGVRQFKFVWVIDRALWQ